MTPYLSYSACPFTDVPFPHTLAFLASGTTMCAFRWKRRYLEHSNAAIASVYCPLCDPRCFEFLQIAKFVGIPPWTLLCKIHDPLFILQRLSVHWCTFPPHARLFSIRYDDVCIPLKAAVFRTFKRCDSIGLLLHSRRPTLINSFKL